jgi:cell division septal protein FtsQ
MSRPAKPRPRPRRRASGHARRPGRPLRHRLRGRLPSAARILAGLLLVASLAGFVMLVNGPWFRVVRVAAAGAQFTAADDLDALLSRYQGTSLLTVDSEALSNQLRALPAVAAARVTPRLPDTLEVRITEKAPAFWWLTRSARLVVAADGSVIASLAPDAELPGELATLPSVDDRRSASRRLAVGGALPQTELEMASRLLGLDPSQVGSANASFQLQLDDQYGFILVGAAPPWTAALGFYRLDPEEGQATADARMAAQIAAIRTLFSTRPEAGVSWVDARNPGKVYWAP